MRGWKSDRLLGGAFFGGLAALYIFVVLDTVGVTVPAFILILIGTPAGIYLWLAWTKLRGR
jgi:hypothetical protein